MKTIKINISEAKTNLSKYAKMVKKGHTVILADRNVPFAEIIPLSKSSAMISEKRKKMLGDLRKKVIVLGDINKPLSKKELNEWYVNNL